jgi:ABC-type dipeptide/oligopeptide/nickel transport system permease subunit
MATKEATRTADSLLDVERTLRDRAAYFGRFLWRDRSGVIGLIVFSIVVFSAILAPAISPYDPLKQNLRDSKMLPAWSAEGSRDHPFGTDNLGRDILSRVIYGTRVSLTVGFFGVLIAGTLGLVIGAIAGYLGGRVDAAIMGVINLILSLPYLLFVVFIASILGRSLLNVILIFGITDSPVFARVTRGEVLRTFEMSAMIFYEAGLGFLGLSVPPTVPSWGNMLAAGRKYLTSYPWIATFPGLAIMFTSLGMNLLGDWLRDVLDPRLRRARK